MTPEEKALRDLWMSEMWTPVHELPRGERAAKRRADRRTQRRAEEIALEKSRRVA